MPSNLIAMNKVKQILQWYTRGVPELKLSQLQDVIGEKTIDDALLDLIVHNAYRIENDRGIIKKKANPVERNRGKLPVMKKCIFV